MTVLLQTRVPREVAVRFKSAARARGKSIYRALGDLAAEYADQAARPKFASEAYVERFALPTASKFKAELRRRMQRRHEKHH